MRISDRWLRYVGVYLFYFCYRVQRGREGGSFSLLRDLLFSHFNSFYFIPFERGEERRMFSHSSRKVKRREWFCQAETRSEAKRRGEEGVHQIETVTGIGTGNWK